MITAEFINSPLFIAVLTIAFGVIGWVFRTLFGKLKEQDSKMEVLGLAQVKCDQSNIELINIRASLAGFGVRIGNTESELAVMQSNHDNIMEALKEIKSSEKETSQAFISTLTDLQKTIQNMSVDVACIKQKIGV